MHEVRLENDNNVAPKEFTEVFSWGSDRFGQLGLGPQMSEGKASHGLPRLCSYNIPIHQISCGARHAAFITSK
jgi:alpha-tubulin suppressor-like RCC1 family protein